MFKFALQDTAIDFEHNVYHSVDVCDYIFNVRTSMKTSHPRTIDSLVQKKTPPVYYLEGGVQ